MQVKMVWPPQKLLVDLSATLIRNKSTRVIEIFGRKYCEGLLESTLRSLDNDMFDSLG